AALSTLPFSPGTAWDRLHYVLGFGLLGHEVLLVEEVPNGSCTDGRGRTCAYGESVNREAFCQVTAAFGLRSRACQLYDGGRETTGLDAASLRDAVEGADLLLNISGHVKADVVLDGVKRRAYLDQDPVYTQLWLIEHGVDLGLERHDVLFTVGMNVGTSHSPVPDAGRTWHHCPSVVVPELWPCDPDPSCTRFTTVASWGRYADLQHRGRWYCSKRDQFRRLAGLPRASDQPMEVAMREAGGDDPDLALLRDAGWIVTDAGALAERSAYSRYIRGSRAEIGIAKHAYVEGRAGWLGDRSCHYLASGKPVLTQSTGIERWLPTGRGLLTFRDQDEAVSAVHAVNADYAAHSRAARSLVERYFSYRTVLPTLVDTAMSAAP
ncbi:MAG: glycosyltransferase, partial [Actinomycetota bacterium]|nr:glycosyltransferase [Actinomycetota bacterium]